ncbi:hypothetical protein D770_20595 [Flammeovirgaceae bacterium 311]|nr:hypothetical protein D770_20595 [Flammeovirgaceae bacterium 311]
MDVGHTPMLLKLEFTVFDEEFLVRQELSENIGRMQNNNDFHPRFIGNSGLFLHRSTLAANKGKEANKD